MAKFTDLELFAMFNVDIMPDAPHEAGDRRPYAEGPYEFNDIKCQLWSIVKRDPTRGERNALQTEDHLKAGVSTHPPGSKGRIDDMASYYAKNSDREVSPFAGGDEPTCECGGPIETEHPAIGECCATCASRIPERNVY